MVPIASESVVNVRIGEISWPVIRCNSCLLRTSRKESCDQMIVALDHQNGWTYRDVSEILKCLNLVKKMTRAQCLVRRG